MTLKAINKKIAKLVEAEGIAGFKAELYKGEGYHYFEMEVLVDGVLKSFETESYYIPYTSHAEDKTWVEWVTDDIKVFVDNYKKLLTS